MNLILFGFKGCGKTHFGQLLSQLLNCPLIETDSLLEIQYQKSVREIYQQLGEKQFRICERETILSLKNIENSIISLGGGAVLNQKNVEFLTKIGKLIYLKADAQTLKKRMLQQGIPLFLDPQDLDRSFKQMMQSREPIYQSIPALTIDTDALTETQILTQLMREKNGF